MKKEIPIWEKCLLTIKEAAQYYGLGENKLREIIKQNENEDFYLMNGTKVLIKREKFEKYILDTSSI